MQRRVGDNVRDDVRSASQQLIMLTGQQCVDVARLRLPYHAMWCRRKLNPRQHNASCSI